MVFIKSTWSVMIKGTDFWAYAHKREGQTVFRMRKKGGYIEKWREKERDGEGGGNDQNAYIG